MNIVHRLWLGLGALTALLALSGIAMVVRVRAIEESLLHQAHVALPRVESASRLEVLLQEYSENVRDHESGTEGARSRAKTTARRIDEERERFRLLATRDGQIDASWRLDGFWKLIREHGEAALLAERSAAASVAELERVTTQAIQFLGSSQSLARAVADLSPGDRTLKSLVAIVVAALLIVGGVLVAIATNRVVRNALILSARESFQDRETLQVTLASIGDGVVTTGNDGRVTYLNPVAERWTGWTSEEAAGQPLSSFVRAIPASGAEVVETVVADPLAGPLADVAVERSTDSLLVSRDGEEIRVDDTIANIRDAEGQVHGRVHVFRDVTQRRRTELLLAERLRLLRLGAELGATLNTTDATPDVLQRCVEMLVEQLEAVFAQVWVLDAAGSEPRLVAGAGRAEDVGTGSPRWLSSDLTIRRVIATRKPQVTDRIDGLVGDWALASSVACFGGFPLLVENRVVGVLGIFAGSALSELALDAIESSANQIAAGLERRRADQELIDALDFSESVVDSVSSSLIVLDSELRIVRANRAFYEYYAMDESDAEGRPIWEIPSPVQRWARADLDRIADELRAGARRAISYEIVQERVDRGPRYLTLRAQRLRGSRGVSNFCLVVAEDFTDRREAERVREERRDRMQTELDTMSRLHALGTRVLASPDVESALDEILHAVQQMTGAEKGCVQVAEGSAGSLKLVALRGFEPELQESYARVCLDENSASGRAVKRREQVLIEDVLLDEQYAALRESAAKAGYRAVLASPLVSRSGRLHGVFTVLFQEPRKLTPGEARLFDLCARQAADLLERDRLEERVRERERHYRLLAESMPQLIWVLDESGKLSYANPRWWEFTGSKQAPDEAHDWSRYCVPEEIELVRERWRSARDSSKAAQFEFRYRRVDGSVRWMLARVVPFTSERGALSGWLFSATDITRMREATAALESADRRKDEFLATLAHELRNPLAPIRNSIEILKRSDESDPGVWRRAAATMDRQLRHLTSLVDDLLDVSRISRDKLRLRLGVVELASIVHHAIEASRPLLDNAGHELLQEMPSEPIYLRGDPTRLVQIFGNLITNACNYTEPGGKITIRVERRAGEARVSISDTGIGIPASELAGVFDMFKQIDGSLERSSGGLGLGLTLVKRLTELHGGHVEARSEGEGRGAELVVYLPALDEAPETNSEASPVESGSRIERRILVVDDNRDSAASLASLLRLESHTVHVAHDGEEALREAERVKPDAILLDIGLPRLNGYEVCLRIRGETWGSKTLIIALTGWGQAADRQRSRDSGFDGHLVKPVDFVELSKMLNDGRMERADGCD